MKLIHAAGLGAMLVAAGAMAADLHYPTRPIRLFVPQAADGSNDIMARNVASHLTASFGRQVVVDNLPGAEGQTRAVNRDPACGM
jgi:tripartite-type tricarboxylate transporter receptor subunit TctC